MVRSTTHTVVLLLTVLCGLCIGWVDSRPGWDDTGITVGVIFVVSALLGGVLKERSWLVALVTAAPLAILELVLTGGSGAFIAFIPAFVGAYAGAFARRAF